MNKIRSANLDILKRPRVLGAIGVVVVLLIAWYFAWWSPESSKLASVQQQQVKQTQQISSLNARLQEIVREDAIVAKYRNFLTFFGSQVPVQPEQGQLVYMLGRLEKSDNVDISSINASTTSPPATGSTLSTIPISMSVSGPHNNVIKFLSDLYSLPRLITIQSVSPSPTAAPAGVYNVLGRDKVPFQLTLTGTAYFSGQVAATP